MFKELFVDSIIGEIKKMVAAEVNISLSQNSMNINEGLERADRGIFNALMDILGDKNILAEENINYNFFLIDINRPTEDSEYNEYINEKLKSHLLLYYTALYFDNVNLLGDLLKAGVYNCKDSFSLTLCFLDREISDLFGDEYLEIVQNAGGFFKPFYKSINEVYGSDRKKYLDKFSRILKERKNCEFYKNGNYILFTKENLDVLDLESYLALSDRQLSLMSGSSFTSIQDKDRLNSLMQNSKYINFDFSLVFLEELLDMFNDSELLEIAENMEYFERIKLDNKYDRKRLFNLFKRRKEISKFTITKDIDFLQTFSDDEILTMSFDVLEFLEYNAREFLNFGNACFSKSIIKRCNKEIKLLEKRVQ